MYTRRKSMKEYLYFKLVGHKPRTDVYEVRAKSDDFILGTIKWYAPWRQYCFFPTEDKVFSKGCLNQVNEFIDKLMEERKTIKPHRVLDIADMPNFNCLIRNGIYSVSEGKIIYTKSNYVTCKEHRACLAVNKECTIWRCPTCHEGAYVEW